MSGRAKLLQAKLMQHDPPRRRLIVELACEAKCCTTRQEARLRIAASLEEVRQARQVNFGVIEIMAIIQLALAIWRFIDEMGWLEATPEEVEEAIYAG